jgi:hypothetical protein
VPVEQSTQGLVEALADLLLAALGMEDPIRRARRASMSSKIRLIISPHRRRSPIEHGAFIS